MLLALLLPDPNDENCPADFIDKARTLLERIPGKTKQLARAAGNDSERRKRLRGALLHFIGDFANWDLSSDRNYLEVSRELVKAAHGDEPPLVVDPFAGGGSIPYEALRLGCEALASDLNPVACFILKTLLEDIPRNGAALGDELRRVGTVIKNAAQTELAEFYPNDPDEARPIAYLWARTVRCETPNCGAEIPLIRSFWLGKRSNRRRALRYECIRRNDGVPRIEFAIFEPKSEIEVPNGTVARAKATCLCCQIVLSPDRVRAQLSEQRGGADVVFDSTGGRVGGARLLAVATQKSGRQWREFRSPTERDYEAIWRATNRINAIANSKLANGCVAIPDEPTPLGGGSGAGRAFSVQKYGMKTFADLFTARQKLAMITLGEAIAALSDNSNETAELTALALSRCADINNALCSWKASMTQVIHLFTRQALPIVWDFAEANPLGEQAGDYSVTIGNMARILDQVPSGMIAGQVEIADACASPLPDATVSTWFTDPPYYDAVPYADLSDFFFVWLKRTLPNHPILRDPFDLTNPLTPKQREAVQDELKLSGGSPKDRMFFEQTMAKAFAEGRRVLRDDGVGCIVFAHKSTEGWEALLAGIIQGGWIITGSWPIATEMVTRLRARESAALATSIHLICRPRTDNMIGDWQKVLRELPNRVGDWMERLQSEGVRGADLVFACIGPALEIYSRFAKVVDAEEREIPLGGDPEAKDAHKRGYLAYVWEVVGRMALEQVLGTAEAKARNGAAGALEEDARLTALFLWTLQSTNGSEAKNGEERSDDEEEMDVDEESDELKAKKKKGFTLIFDVARRFAQPLGIHLEDWEDRIIETKKGVVRLLPVSERGKQLFGETGMQTIATELERGSKDSLQMTLYPDLKEAEPPKVRGRRGRIKGSDHTSDRKMQTRWEPTTLDRVHAAMLLQASGRANALRALLESEQERGPDFLRLANALSALYPKDAEEKRLLDAMLLAVPR